MDKIVVRVDGEQWVLRSLEPTNEEPPAKSYPMQWTMSCTLQVSPEEVSKLKKLAKPLTISMYE